MDTPKSPSTMAPVTAPHSVWHRIGSILLAPLHWLERTRGRWRLLLLLAYVLVLTGIGLLIWRYKRLETLPDVGHPFDVETFLRAGQVPDERNAWVLYKKAIASLRNRDPKVEGLVMHAAWGRWSLASPEVRAWVEVNRPALEIWLEGTTRPDAALLPYAASLGPLQDLHLFSLLPLLEADRLSEAGDHGGAWRVLRGMLRCSLHKMRRGGVIHRSIAEQGMRCALHGITRWASDLKIDPELIRHAIDELAEDLALTTPLSETLKAEYLHAMESLDDPSLHEQVRDEILRKEVDNPAYFVPGVADLHWFLRHEPEYSRRVVRLLFANWLTQVDKPAATHAPLLTPPGQPNDPHAAPVFDVSADPEAPPAASALDFDTLGASYRQSALARQVSVNAETLLPGEESGQSMLIEIQMRLAVLYFVKVHGRPPRSLEELVGVAIDLLPDEVVNDGRWRYDGRLTIPLKAPGR